QYLSRRLPVVTTPRLSMSPAAMHAATALHAPALHTTGVHAAARATAYTTVKSASGECCASAPHPAAESLRSPPGETWRAVSICAHVSAAERIDSACTQIPRLRGPLERCGRQLAS